MLWKEQRLVRTKNSGHDPEAFQQNQYKALASSARAPAYIGAPTLPPQLDATPCPYTTHHPTPGDITKPQSQLRRYSKLRSRQGNDDRCDDRQIHTVCEKRKTQHIHLLQTLFCGLITRVHPCQGVYDGPQESQVDDISNYR